MLGSPTSHRASNGVRLKRGAAIGPDPGGQLQSPGDKADRYVVTQRRRNATMPKVNSEKGDYLRS
jgi:hypothetical protein